MPDYVERLMQCGVDELDAWEIVDDFIYDEDFVGLAEYVRSFELRTIDDVC